MNLIQNLWYCFKKLKQNGDMFKMVEMPNEGHECIFCQSNYHQCYLMFNSVPSLIYEEKRFSYLQTIYRDIMSFFYNICTRTVVTDLTYLILIHIYYTYKLKLYRLSTGQITIFKKWLGSILIKEKQNF